MQFSTKCWSEHILSVYKATKDLKHPLYMTFNLCSFLFYISHLYFIFSYYVILYYCLLTFVFKLCSLLFYKRLFICDTLHLYSIVKAQQNICALLGLMRVFAAGWAYRGRRGEGLEGTIIYWVGMVG